MTEADYAGDVSPNEAWEMLAGKPDAVLIDVRTPAEWHYVGRPELGALGKATRLVPWQIEGGGPVNPDFLAQVQALDPGEDAPILLLCRSGVRSRNAALALTKAGFRRCYNVSDGFEGGHDGDRHRGAVAGWKASGLPWAQD